MVSKLILAMGCSLVFLASLTPASSMRRQPAEGDVTPEQVREAIKNGIEYLKSKQRAGNWEHMTPQSLAYRGGLTSLALLALLEAGVSPDEEVIKKGIEYLRKLKAEDTYVVALQTMALSRAYPDKDRLQIKENVDWLRRALHTSGGKATGWSYKESGGYADNSNSQYAVLGLHYAHTNGVPVDDEVWKLIQEFYKRTQLANGGWDYREEHRGSTERLTMTTAGVSGLLITAMALYKNKEVLDNEGNIKNCGQRAEDDHLEKGLRRIGEEFAIRNVRGWRFYNIYGIERAGRLSGRRLFAGHGRTHDWYRVGAEYLVRTQVPGEGCWRSQTNEELTFDGNPVIATSFALLFLSKGKMPVLMHKMMHGRPPRAWTGDWNNDPNDVRNLVEFCSREVFKKDGRPVPLTWQVFDASRSDPGDPQTVADMLQAPILFFSGHEPPRFSEGEKHLLKAFVEQGGFIWAEACCGRPEFTAGFRALAKELWPERALEPLAEGHPIWTTAYKVPVGMFKLEGIEFGCKTNVVFAPQDLSCYWEANKLDGLERGLLAFRTGANIVAYATGLEPPEDKLATKTVVSDREDPIVRNFLQVAQINYGGPDWQPAPRAMRNVMDYLAKQHRIDVVLQTKPITIGDANLPNFKFLYMHGRREFTIPDEHQKVLRKHLENGGLLLADACCGSAAFDRSFRVWMESMFGRSLQKVKPDDPLYSDKIGKSIKTLAGRTQRGAPYAPLVPQIEGIRLDPKDEKSPWIVLYSPLDLGCALDKHQSSDCLGYNHESALVLAAQAVLYALKE